MSDQPEHECKTTLQVTYFNHQVIQRVVQGVGWSVNTARRVLVIGHGVPREEIPLDNVMMWRILPCSIDHRSES